MRNINKSMVEVSDLRVGLVKIELWYYCDSYHLLISLHYFIALM